MDPRSSESKESLLEGSAPYRRLLAHLQPHRSRFFIGLALSLLAGVSSTALMAVMSVVFKLVLGGELSFQHKLPLLGTIDLTPWFRTWLPEGEWQTLGRVSAICLVVPLFMGIRGALDFAANYQLNWVTQRLTLDLRKQVFERLLHRSLSFFNAERASELINTVLGMTSLCSSTAISLAGDLIRRPAALLAALIFLTLKDPIFMGFSLIAFPICMLPVVLLRRKVRKTGRVEQELAAGISGIMMEAIAGVRIVKSHAREHFEAERFSRLAQEVNRNAMRIFRAVEIVGPLVETAASFGIAAGLVYCWARGISFDDFSLRVGLLVMLYPDVKALSRMQMLAHRCSTASEQVFKMLDEPPEVPDSPNAIPLQKAQGDLRFENVTFSYRPGAAPAVQNLNLHFQPGKFYALVGESGAGKSTLVALILRFYDPQAGRILLDGHDLRDLQQHALRNQVGIVNQDLFLFHDSIENNIRYGRLEASEDDIHNAARMARAEEFILRQPNGYQTTVGDKGCNLSGGQLQRITIARAILRNAPILLLDEATSNLDTDTEQAFKDALQVLRKDRTIVAIAHRFSTILEADQIIVMDQGRVLDQGTHAQLVERCQTYERLFRLQFATHESNSDREVNIIP
jgi:ABC-type multidrug transport system fused ATPase/permease subunit